MSGPAMRPELHQPSFGVQEMPAVPSDGFPHARDTIPRTRFSLQGSPHPLHEIFSITI